MREQVRSQLRELTLRNVEHPVKGDAAVLIPIVIMAEQPQFLLTKRTDTVSTHRGQISFPGGTREKQDASLIETALRETREELGLEARHIEVAGRFHDYLSVTELRVRPFVGFVRNSPKLQPNPEEVQKVLRVPFEFFAQTTPQVERRRKFGREISVYHYQYGGEVIWGLTATIIRDFLALLSGSPA